MTYKDFVRYKTYSVVRRISLYMPFEYCGEIHVTLEYPPLLPWLSIWLDELETAPEFCDDVNVVKRQMQKVHPIFMLQQVYRIYRAWQDVRKAWEHDLKVFDCVARDDYRDKAL